MDIRRERFLGIGSELLEFIIYFFFKLHYPFASIGCEEFYFWLQIFKLRK